MNNMKQKILSLLVLLLTAASGAWADGVTITLTSGQTVKTYEDVTLPWSTTAEILKEVVTDLNFNVNINAISGGDGKVVKYGNENFTVTGTFSGDATVTVTYNMGSSATITVTAPGPLMTLSDDGKTATMESMPGSDITIDYELVRDMAISMPVTVGDGEDGFRIRVKKNEQQQFEPAEMQFDAMLALFTVNDEIEEKTLTFYGQTVDCKLSIFAVDDNNEPTGDAIAFADLEPGRYVAIATAAEGSAYDGTTAPSNIFELYQGYEVTVPAGEYATFYKNENLYVEDENAELYTISSVTDTEAVLSEAIDVAPALTPLLVFNSSDEAKTILLIPTEEEADNVEAYEGFKGTLEAKEMSGSNEETDFYVCNGKNFVWVKGAGTIGANKCWLEVSKNAAARKLNIVIGEATGVNAVESGKWNVESLYDLNGRKLQGIPTKKGVYILNGRKVVVK